MTATWVDAVVRCSTGGAAGCQSRLYLFDFETFLGDIQEML